MVFQSRIAIYCANHTSEQLNNDLTDYLSTTLPFTAQGTLFVQLRILAILANLVRTVRSNCHPSRLLFAPFREHIETTPGVRYNRPTQARGTYLVHQTQRLHSTAVHHVISSATRFEATTNLFFIHYLPSSRLAAPSTTTISRPTSIL